MSFWLGKRFGSRRVLYTASAPLLLLIALVAIIAGFIAMLLGR
jgi:hypothetical protein